MAFLFLAFFIVSLFLTAATATGQVGEFRLNYGWQGPHGGSMIASPQGAKAMCAAIFTAQTCTMYYAPGTVVLITATPDPSSALESWEGCDSVNGNQCTVTMTEDKAVIANFGPPPPFLTGIGEIKTFLEFCPTKDPAYNKIRQDFEILVDGAAVGPIACTGPVSAMPISQYTDELIALQTFRTAYYMDRGTEGRLPWTDKGLYEWMSSHIAGVNIKSAPGQLYCCDQINGKSYFSESRQDEFNRDLKRTWPGIAITLDYFAHEIRHADAGAPGHTTGCPAFPLPTDPAGCDPSYNIYNLGSYGVQYWLESSWATGNMNIGIGCSSQDTAYSYVSYNADSANNFRDRFVTNAPPLVSIEQPYGGSCACAARISGDLGLHVPFIKYNNQYLWADFAYIPGTAKFSATAAGWITDTSPFSGCSASTLDADLSIHIPAAIFAGYSFWLDFQYTGNQTVFLLNAGGLN